jgi:membrane-associated phospholipid phosphatase
MIHHWDNSQKTLIAFTLISSIIFYYISVQIPQEWPLLYLDNFKFEPFVSFFKYITYLGESGPYFVFGLFFIYKQDKLYAWIAGLGLTVMLVSNVLKEFFYERRPYFYLVEKGYLDNFHIIEDLHLGNNSFPSGHTLSAFAIFVFIILSKRKPFVWNFLLLLMAFCVAVSRVYIGHHFMQDVCAGAIIGTLLGILFDGIRNQTTKNLARI